MPHLSQLTAVVIDAPEELHEAACGFWSAATGSQLRVLDHDEFHGARIRPDLVLLVQRLGSGSPGVHLDIHTDDLDAEVSRLEAAGAVAEQAFGEWTVMVDPVGVRFCVVQAPAGALDPATCASWP